MSVALMGLLTLPTFAFGAEAPSDPSTWPEDQRGFWFDGPGFLLDEEARDRFLAGDDAERSEIIESLLGRDPDPSTPVNELEIGIERRRQLVAGDYLTFLDDRARVLFLNGPPTERQQIDCDQVFKPLEIWTYAGRSPRLIFHQKGPEQPYRLWLPLETKRVLYATEMEYWLEQFHELRQYIRGKRFDLQLCRYAETIDEITGIEGLYRQSADRPSNNELLSWLAGPADIDAWARAAAATPLDALPAQLPIESVEAVYPRRQGQRILSRITMMVPTEKLEVFTEGDANPEYRLQVAGVVEADGRVFEEFRMRYQIDATAQPDKVALVVERPLRPRRQFQVRMRVRDEISGAQHIVTTGLDVPDQPEEVPELPVPDSVVVAIGDQMAQSRIAGRDGIALVPPETDVVLGLWRADTLVSGDRIKVVKFLVDGNVQLSRSRPPYSAELRLSKYPTEQAIRVEGYDEANELVASDELLINQQRGELEVSITEPPRGGNVAGRVRASADVTVPEERRVTRVEFSVNEEIQAVREAPPWEAEIDVPVVANAQDVVYLTVTAELDNGLRAEDVRFLSTPEFLDAVEVDLVELYTTVTNASNRPVEGLVAEDFQVFEDGRPQRIARFELVVDLPLTVGITVDTSGSMLESLGEARRAAVGFLESVMTPKDKSFAVSFSDRPELLMPRTSDVGAVAEALDSLSAIGSTALHDAVVTSLYYFRGVKGRRALILLSDGEDTASTIAFREALEYARRSGVSIYTVGLGIGRLDFDVRRKLKELAEETGGRDFFINRAQELHAVYKDIERELRSQYLIAYNSDRPESTESEYRQVEVKVKGRLKARTLRGYYP